jgi:hypothetical protein
MLQELVAVVQVLPPGFDVAVYAVMVSLPVDAGAVQLTVAVPAPVVALTPVGAPGAEVVVNDDALAEELEPTALVATTEKV